MATAEPAYTDADDACELMESIGMRPFPWQRAVLRDLCGRDESDRPAFVTVGLSVPRQNGKNAILECYEVYELAVCGAHILHTAHRVKTAKKSFQRLVRYFTDKRHPELSSLVVNIRYTNGEEAIHLSNGASVEFSARSRAGNRGFDDIQIVVFDEAQDLTDDQLNAIMYTLAASSTGDRQMVFMGTPPDPTSPGTVFARNRETAMRRPPARSLWLEWGAAEMPPTSSTFADVVEEVYRCNPSMGYTLDEEFTETEFGSSTMDGFARERLGWWSTQAASCAIKRADWDACAVDAGDAPTSGKKAFAVKFSPDGATVALAACRAPEDAPAHVELVGMAPLSDGIGWLTGLLCDEDMADTTAAVAVDGRNGAGALIERLSACYPPQAVMAPGSRGVADAASMFEQALYERAVTHCATEGQAALDESALTAIKRPIGSDGGWGYGGAESPAIEAAALALWAAKTTKRDPDGYCEVY